MDTQTSFNDPPVNPQTQNSQSELLQQIVQSGENIQQTVPAEQPVAQVEYAGFWARFAAYMLDSLILGIPVAIVNVLLPIPILGMVLFFAYMICMLNFKQATLGKMAVGLKVTTSSGEKPEIGKIILRETIGKIVSGIILYVGFLMVAFTKKKQGLHDMIADTVVVWDPARKRRKWLVVVGIAFGLIMPIIIMIMLSSIIIVSTQAARQKAIDARNKLNAQQKVIEKVQIEMEQVK